MDFGPKQVSGNADDETPLEPEWAEWAKFCAAVAELRKTAEVSGKSRSTRVGWPV
jgi:hypothetical protein